MKTMVILLMSLVLMVGVVHAQETVITEKAGDLTVTARFAQAPYIGENDVKLEIKDQAGALVKNALVNVTYYMTERASATRKAVEMPYHSSKTAAVFNEDGYKAKLNFNMPGSWMIAVQVKLAESQQYVHLHVTLK